MPFYALQIRTQEVEKFLSLARRGMVDTAPKLLWPRRRLRIRRARNWHDTVAPLFPGYLFLQADDVDAALFRHLRSIPGFIRFLPSNKKLTPMDQRDQETLLHFLAFGEIVDRSSATFDVNGRIRVLAGPLKGLEGWIVKVDRRKGRAKVRMQFYEDSFEVDFGFEVLEASAAKAEDSKAGEGKAGDGSLR